MTWEHWSFRNIIVEAQWVYGEWIEKGQCKDRQRGDHSVNYRGWKYGGSLYSSLSVCVPLTFFTLQSLIESVQTVRPIRRLL